MPPDPELAVNTVPRPATEVSERLAPFVAWLATREFTETVRREHREAVEGFLQWARTDSGDHATMRRYELHLSHTDPAALAATRLGLARYTEYQQVLAQTLPINHH